MKEVFLLANGKLLHWFKRREAKGVVSMFARGYVTYSNMMALLRMYADDEGEFIEPSQKYDFPTVLIFAMSASSGPIYRKVSTVEVVEVDYQNQTINSVRTVFLEKPITYSVLGGPGLQDVIKLGGMF